MVDKGVIDPALVTRAALENAVSIAAMVLTTNCLVSEKEDDTPPVQPTGMSGAPPMPAERDGRLLRTCLPIFRTTRSSHDTALPDGRLCRSFQE